MRLAWQLWWLSLLECTCSGLAAEALRCLHCLSAGISLITARQLCSCLRYCLPWLVDAVHAEQAATTGRQFELGFWDGCVALGWHGALAVRHVPAT
jgi:hypothetical protein